MLLPPNLAPLRIALILDPINALVGGGRHTLELARALAGRGHEVKTFGTPAEWMEGVAGSDLEREGKVGSRVRLFQPDALIAYDALSPAAWLGSRIARRRRVPLVLVEAGAWGKRKFLQRCLWRIGEALWGPYVRRSASALIALDPIARERALERGFAAPLVQFVPQGVDLDQFRPGLASSELARHRVRGRVLSCRAPFDAFDELELLITAFARTVGQRDDWSLVVSGDREIPAQLRSCADRLGVGGRVHFLALGEAALASLLSSSTLFAAVTDHGTGALLDVGRALACGVPVIAASSARTSCLVQHGENGLVAPPGDLGAWIECLRNAASSPERRKRWSYAARRTAEERLSWSAVAAQFEALLARSEPEAPLGGTLGPGAHAPAAAH